MTQKEIVLLYSYMYNNRVRLEREVRDLQAFVRFREVDESDCMELMFKLIELHTFLEVCEQIRLLLKMKRGNEL